MLYKQTAKLLLVTLCLLTSVAIAQNIVTSISKAPTSHSGDVAGVTAAFWVNLDLSYDPAIEGRSLPAGKSIRVALPPELVQTDPSVPTGTPPGCAGAEKCNTIVLLQGWPQKPVAFPKYSASFEAPNTIVITANADIAPDGNGPGIKFIHLALQGFTNPVAGDYEISVVSETGFEGAVEQGSATYSVRPETVPHISVNSILSDKPGTNLIYQEARIREETPLPFDFLLWDSNGEGMTGVTVSPDGKSLVQGDTVVGSIAWDGPVGNLGQKVFTKEPSKAILAPPISVPTAHLRVHFLAGDLTGHHSVTFSLNGGTSQTMHVFVTDPSAGSSHSFVKVNPFTSDSNGNNMVKNCGGTFPDARARMMVNQVANSTDVNMMVSNARPNTLFTVWFWLKAKDQNGNTFGGNPLSGKSGAPFAPSTAYEELLNATGSGNGVTEGSNVFTTDADGNGTFSTTLDYPMFGGAYPFHKITSFDPLDSRLPIDNARIYPVALLTPSPAIDMPFMVRIASHCTDGQSHGWSAGAREPWFDFPR